MKVWIYSNNFNEINLKTCDQLIGILKKKNVEIGIYKDLEASLKSNAGEIFNTHLKKADSADVLISVGGDGTILNAISELGGESIPILGVNTGRLGFLTSISPDEMEATIQEILAGKYESEDRSLLEMRFKNGHSEDISYALNEISVLKKDSSSMITIHAEIDGHLLNTYWADGLIVATATGSTAYSLSCGGPIVEPGSGNFIITPIAPHNLNVRPLVIPDNRSIVLRFNSRSKDLLVAVDSSSKIISDDSELHIRKSDKKVRLVRLEGYDYFETLRKKLNWGLDQRN